MDLYLTKEEMDAVRENGFDQHGLRFSIEELQEVVPQNLSMEELAKYVDAITFAKVHSNDSSFFNTQLVDIPVGMKITVTATGLGNLAYVALHMKDENIALKASTLFDKIILFA